MLGVVRIMKDGVSKHLESELPHLWRFAVRLTRSTSVAEDLVQKTAVRALERRYQFKVGSVLRSWLYSIMHSIWKNELRSAAVRQNASFTVNDIDDVCGASCQGENQHLFRAVIGHVNRLPEAQRTVMLLVCVEGYSYQETASILDIAIGTVMSRLARARLQIGQSFLSKDENPEQLTSSQSSISSEQ